MWTRDSAVAWLRSPTVSGSVALTAQQRRHCPLTTLSSLHRAVPQGYASHVYRAQCRYSGQEVVLKVYNLASICDLYQYQIFREIRLHSRLQHESIVNVGARGCD